MLNSLTTRTTAHGPTEERKAFKPCTNRNNSAGHPKECPKCREHVAVVDRAKFEAWKARRDPWHQDLDDDDYRQARTESDAIDAAVDQGREERHHG